MSGRRLVLQPDGRRTWGYRKTLIRRAPRSPAHLLPDWLLGFELPHGISFPPDYEPGIIGLTLLTGHVFVCGKNKDWVVRKASAFFAQELPQWRGTILARLTRANEPGPTLSGPLRRGGDRVIEITITGRALWIGDSHGTRQLSLELT